MRGPVLPAVALQLLLSCPLQLAAGVTVHAAGAPIGRATALRDDTITRFAATYQGKTYHYDLYVPIGYEGSPQKKFPVLFVCSPGGNAALGNMEEWVRGRRWLAVMLVEAQNGPTDVNDANFYAAHDDVVRRARVRTDRKFVTGFSGGARMAARFALFRYREGIAGLFLQGAGSEWMYNYGFIRFDLPVFASFGTSDFNLPELAKMRAAVPKKLFGSEVFDGGHEWAPVATAARALTWLDAQVEANGNAHTLTVRRKGCGVGKVFSDPWGIYCGSDCSERYFGVADVTVALQVSAEPGSKFIGWSGACSGTGACVLGMTAGRTVEAEFIQEQDTDCDGLGNAVETNTRVFVSAADTGTDPRNPDTDGDGWGDGVEVSHGTDPNDPLRHAVRLSFASSAAQDGWVLESTESSRRGGSANSSGTTLRLGDDALDRQYRGILSFDTSALPDDAVLVGVTLKVHAAGRSATTPLLTHGPLVADVKAGAFGVRAALQASDFQAAASLLKAASFGATPASGWFSAQLAAASLSAIQRGGLTQFRLRFARDDNDNGMADIALFHSGNAVAPYRPVLDVAYVP